MDVLQIFYTLVILAIAALLWYKVVAPWLVANGMAFVASVMPVLVAIVVIIWLLLQIFGGALLHTKVF